jgi:hypothetical protein
MATGVGWFDIVSMCELSMVSCGFGTLTDPGSRSYVVRSRSFGRDLSCVDLPYGVLDSLFHAFEFCHLARADVCAKIVIILLAPLCPRASPPHTAGRASPNPVHLL